MQEKKELLLKGFRKWVENLGRNKETIDAHIEHVRLYLDTKQAGEVFIFPVKPDEMDPAQLNSFFLEEIYRKVPGLTCPYLRRTITSVKKFYTFLFDTGHVTREERNGILRSIKAEKEHWLQKCHGPG